MKIKFSLLAFSLMAVLCSAQTAVQLLPNPRFKGWDATGTIPLALGKVCTYQAGTTTPLATYTDSTGNVQNTNPVILNVAGEADIWFSATAAYKITLLTAGTDNTCSTGAQIWSKDNISQKYFRFDGSNVLTAIPDPSVALGEFWLSSTNPGFLKWSDASAIHTLVGADSTQTLTNKTLNGASSGNAVTLLSFQGTLAPVVGTGSNVTLYTYTLLANVMQAGKGIRITVGFNHSTGTGSVAYSLNSNGSAFATYTTATAGYGEVQSRVFNNSGLTAVQTIINAPLLMGTVIAAGGGIGATAVATTSNVTLTFSMNAANTEQVTPGMFIVELIQ